MGVDLKEKGAAGVPLLCDFVAFVFDALCLQFQHHSFHYSMEFVVMKTQKNGTNPTCDSAVVVFVNDKMLPILLFDYMPKVDH